MNTLKVGSLENMIEDLKDTTDYTNGGKCSGCGRCCGNLLPLSKKEFDDIKRYVESRNIQPQKHFIAPMKNEPQFDMLCPFLDTSKEKKCTIYSHRPYICRTYNCHTVNSKVKTDKALLKQKRYVTDMRAAFFGGMTVIEKLKEMGELKP